MNLQAAIRHIEAAGVTLQVLDGNLHVQSLLPLTDAQREWVRAHKDELMELMLADLAVQEAADERAAILDHEGQLQPQDAQRVADLARDFYNHLFGPGKTTNCCCGPAGRYCPEGLRLWDLYDSAARAAAALAPRRPWP